MDSTQRPYTCILLSVTRMYMTSDVGLHVLLLHTSCLNYICRPTHRREAKPCTNRVTRSGPQVSVLPQSLLRLWLLHSRPSCGIADGGVVPLYAVLCSSRSSQRSSQPRCEIRRLSFDKRSLQDYPFSRAPLLFATSAAPRFEIALSSLVFTLRLPTCTPE